MRSRGSSFVGTEVELLDDSASIDSGSQQGGVQCGWRAARVGQRGLLRARALPPPWDTYEIREGHVTVRLTERGQSSSTQDTGQKGGWAC